MAINLRDYSRTGAQRGWGAGWPSCGGAKAAGTAVVTADRSGTRFSVHKRIARLVDLIVDECERRDYQLKAGQTGGYNCRPIGGTSSPSNHSWGLAIDINWLTNPMRKPLTTDIPAWVVALFNRYGFAWGGHYSGTPDAMHFEFMGTPEQADEMTALALRELTATPIPTGGTPMASVRDEVWQGPIDDLLRAGQRPQAWQHMQRQTRDAELAAAASARAAAAAESMSPALQRIEHKLDTLLADDAPRVTPGPAVLTAADHDAIARRVLALLTEHPLVPKG